MSILAAGNHNRPRTGKGRGNGHAATRRWLGHSHGRDVVRDRQRIEPSRLAPARSRRRTGRLRGYRRHGRAARPGRAHPGAATLTPAAHVPARSGDASDGRAICDRGSRSGPGSRATGQLHTGALRPWALLGLWEPRSPRLRDLLPLWRGPGERLSAGQRQTSVSDNRGSRSGAYGVTGANGVSALRAGPPVLASPQRPNVTLVLTPQTPPCYTRRAIPGRSQARSSLDPQPRKPQSAEEAA